MSSAAYELALLALIRQLSVLADKTTELVELKIKQMGNGS